MRLSRDQEEKCLALASHVNGVPVNAPLCGPSPKRLRLRRPPDLVDAAYCLSVTVPVATRSESNQRKWQSRCRRTKEARNAWTATVLRFRLVPPPLPVVVRLTRLGGRSLDKWDNLPVSLKACLDVVCAWLGVDDADPRIRVEYDQEAGPKLGVRVELRPEEVT